VPSAGGPKASMSGSSVSSRVAVWKSAKAAAANGSGAPGKRCEVASEGGGVGRRAGVRKHDAGYVCVEWIL